MRPTNSGSAPRETLPGPVHDWAQANDMTGEDWIWSARIPGVVYEPDEDAFRIVESDDVIRLRPVGSEGETTYYAAALVAQKRGYWLQTRRRSDSG